MDHATEQSYYKRFRAAAIRFEVIGGALLAIGIGANFIFGNSMLAVSLIFAGPGALLLILGGSSLRPHNLVKAFAQQCMREPSREMAQGLLDALHSSKRIRLMGRSIQVVQAAVEVYANTEDADPDIVDQLRRTVADSVVKKMF